MNAAVVFPGQGSQFAGMADPWLGEEAARPVFESATAAIGRDLAEGCHDETALATTAFVQPAILACDLAAFRVLEAAGVTFSGTAGHSLGEFAALVAASVLEVEDALRIVVVRGREMQRAGEQRPGAMSALVGLGTAEAAALCDEARGDGELLVANENSAQQVVISGSVSAVERAEALAADRRVRVIRLRVAGAFHSPLMEPAVEALSATIDEARFAPPRFPVASNVTGTLVTDPIWLRELCKRHVVSPVRWEASAQALAAGGADTFVEAGPGELLTRLAKRVVPGARAIAVGDPSAAIAFVGASS
jgi:[acyl-carrier-protein] S-malonyltransferase